jgi:hypothetical protein
MIRDNPEAITYSLRVVEPVRFCFDLVRVAGVGGAVGFGDCRVMVEEVEGVGLQSSSVEGSTGALWSRSSTGAS